jgi:hypothetical protein
MVFQRFRAKGTGPFPRYGFKFLRELCQRRTRNRWPMAHIPTNSCNKCEVWCPREGFAEFARSCESVCIRVCLSVCVWSTLILRKDLLPRRSKKIRSTFGKRPALPHQPNLYLEPKWLRCKLGGQSAHEIHFLHARLQIGIPSGIVRLNWNHTKEIRLPPAQR